MSFSIVIYGDNQRGSNDYYYIYLHKPAIIRVAWPAQNLPSIPKPMKFDTIEAANKFIKEKLNKGYTYKIVDTEDVMVNIAERKLRKVG